MGRGCMPTHIQRKKRDVRKKELYERDNNDIESEREREWESEKIPGINNQYFFNLKLTPSLLPSKRSVKLLYTYNSVS